MGGDIQICSDHVDRPVDALERGRVSSPASWRVLETTFTKVGFDVSVSDSPVDARRRRLPS